MKTFAFLAAAATLALGLSTGSMAAPLYVINDFATTQNGVNPYSTYLDVAGTSATQGPIGYDLGGKHYTRTVLFQSLANGDPDDYGAYLDIGGGSLNINNDPGVRSRLTLTYDVRSLYQQIAPNSAVQLGVTFSNGLSSLNGPTTIQALLGSTSLGTMTLAQRVDTPLTPEVFSNILLLGSQLHGDSRDMLTFVINGPADYDLTLQRIAVNNYVAAASVPEPAMVGLFGLGALALGLGRRRKR